MAVRARFAAAPRTCVEALLDVHRLALLKALAVASLRGRKGRRRAAWAAARSGRCACMRAALGADGPRAVALQQVPLARRRAACRLTLKNCECRASHSRESSSSEVWPPPSSSHRSSPGIMLAAKRCACGLDAFGAATGRSCEQWCDLSTCACWFERPWPASGVMKMRNRLQKWCAGTQGCAAVALQPARWRAGCALTALTNRCLNAQPQIQTVWLSADYIMGLLQARKGMASGGSRPGCGAALPPPGMVRTRLVARTMCVGVWHALHRRVWRSGERDMSGFQCLIRCRASQRRAAQSPRALQSNAKHNKITAQRQVLKPNFESGNATRSTAAVGSLGLGHRINA